MKKLNLNNILPCKGCADEKPKITKTKPEQKHTHPHLCLGNRSKLPRLRTYFRGQDITPVTYADTAWYLSTRAGRTDAPTAYVLRGGGRYHPRNLLWQGTTPQYINMAR